MYESWVRLFLALAVTAAVGSGCSADGAVMTVNNQTDATVVDMGTDDVAASDDTGGTVDDEDDTSTDPESNPLPTTFVLTNGGGHARSKDHELTIIVGAPQPYGAAENTEHRVLIGPIVPIRRE